MGHGDQRGNSHGSVDLVPRCSKRCAVRVNACLREVRLTTDLEPGGEHKGKTLDRDPLVSLL